ncbi:hypothetical protein BJ973_003925 [Actinoplanes tereljensis]|uniref:Uncharacterized protein n=1 Tax=Paractinoplanes tereljensis TaxID=571912 RepID=A0A919NYG9_9ACTN|nr:hypothetical protein [Actinoplanes tereljensis]GIF25647.1 hypothetical protein Ate02nite_83770 [Actinoplanes tereljensis]
MIFDRLFDDAALFPPGNAPMAEAVPAHRSLRSRFADLVGPFVIPATRLTQLFPYASEQSPIDVSVIVAPNGIAGIPDHPGVRLAAVEIPVVTTAPDARDAVKILDDVLPPHLPAFIEIGWDTRHVLDVLAGTRYRAKLRTGGLRADLFPTAVELADTMAACVHRNIALKCTAGLHHAIRHLDPVTGFEHHGFLNVLLAASALADGESVIVAEGHLEAGYGPGLAAAVRALTPDQAEATRRVFTSFGTCSVLEPVDDLVQLGLLPSKPLDSPL